LSRGRFRDKLIAMHASRATVPLAHLSPGYHPRRGESYFWEIGRGRAWLGGLIIAALLWLGAPALFNWKHVISSSGGRYFVHRTVIEVPAFQQNDPRWGMQLLGNTIDTLGQSGCAVSSAAMIMAAYGVDTDPQRLNAYLTTHGGYVGDGLLVWEKASEVGGGQVEKAYEDAPSYALIDANILKGNPVIVRLHLRNGTTHFVVVVGKQGWDYLIRDPARPAEYGVYPLRQLTSRIEALRFYKVVPPPVLVARPAISPALSTAPASPTFNVSPNPSESLVPSTDAPAVPPATTNTALPTFQPRTPITPPDHAP
jgi:hypothetical protein